MVQWLGLGALTPRGPGLVPGWGTNIPQAGQCGQKKKNLTTMPDSKCYKSWWWWCCGHLVKIQTLCTVTLNLCNLFICLFSLHQFLVVALGILHCGSWAPEYMGCIVEAPGRSCLVACGILVPPSRVEPVSPHCKADPQALDHQGSPLIHCSWIPSHVVLLPVPHKGHPWTLASGPFAHASICLPD